MLKGTERPLASWLKWGLDRFTGYVDYVTAFQNPAGNGERVVLDLGQVKHMAEVTVNGMKVGARLWPPFEFDLTDALQPGMNEICLRVGNLMTNEMMQYADRGSMGTWGWDCRQGNITGNVAAPTADELDGGLFGPVRLIVQTE